VLSVECHENVIEYRSTVTVLLTYLLTYWTVTVLQAGRIMIVYQTRTAQNVRWLAWAIITVSITSISTVLD